jgi:hypothetical protein
VSAGHESGAAGPRVGSAAEEATRLFEAVQDWARRAAGSPAADASDSSSASPPGGATASLFDHLATGSPECRLCPLCQLIGLLRETRPEVTAHLAEAAGALLAALRAAVLAHEDDWAARRSTGVERIDIG